MNMQFTLRQQMEAEIERLLVMLDDMDGDADLEGTADDEPTLGFLEAEGDDISQLTLTVGPDDDREEEHDGAEPDVDDEPSLGWTSAEVADRPEGFHDSGQDLEDQCDDEGDRSDSGIGDFDGLKEQCPHLFLGDQRVE